jgi:hypothetical protein
MSNVNTLEADTVLLEFCDNVTKITVRAPRRRRVLTREPVTQRVIPRPYRTWIVSEAEKGCATASSLATTSITFQMNSGENV